MSTLHPLLSANFCLVRFVAAKLNVMVDQIGISAWLLSVRSVQVLGFLTSRKRLNIGIAATLMRIWGLKKKLSQCLKQDIIL